MIWPVRFRQGKNLAEDLRQTLRSVFLDSHQFPDVANVKFCLLLRFPFGLMFAPLQRWPTPVQGHDKEGVNATIVVTMPMPRSTLNWFQDSGAREFKSPGPF